MSKVSLPAAKETLTRSPYNTGYTKSYFLTALRLKHQMVSLKKQESFGLRDIIRLKFVLTLRDHIGIITISISLIGANNALIVEKASTFPCNGREQYKAQRVGSLMRNIEPVMELNFLLPEGIATADCKKICINII